MGVCESRVWGGLCVCVSEHVSVSLCLSSVCMYVYVFVRESRVWGCICASEYVCLSLFVGVLPPLVLKPWYPSADNKMIAMVMYWTVACLSNLFPEERGRRG